MHAMFPRRLLATLEAVCDLAYNFPVTPVQGGVLSARQGHPPRYLEPALQALVRAGVLESVRGPRGGYRLARTADTIAVADILDALPANNGEDAISPQRSVLFREVILPLRESLRAGVLSQLGEITIQELCDRAHQAGVPCEANSSDSYTI